MDLPCSPGFACLLAGWSPSTRTTVLDHGFPAPAPLLLSCSCRSLTPWPNRGEALFLKRTVTFAALYGPSAWPALRWLCHKSPIIFDCPPTFPFLFYFSFFSLCVLLTTLLLPPSKVVNPPSTHIQKSPISPESPAPDPLPPSSDISARPSRQYLHGVVVLVVAAYTTPARVLRRWVAASPSRSLSASPLRIGRTS